MATTLQEFGFTIIIALQHLSPALDGAMHSLSFLGTIEFYLLIIPFIYWTVDSRVGIRLLLILITVDVLSSALKLLFHEPRPYWLGRVLGLTGETSYALPSSHASASMAVWAYLAYRLNKKWLWILAGVVVLGIGLSRLYLGVHFPHDVLLGWLVGALVVWIFVRNEAPVAAWAAQQRITTQIGVGFAMSLAVILLGQLVQVWISPILDPPAWGSFATQARTPSYSFTDAGALFGAVAGYVLMKRYAPFLTRASLVKRFGRYALGMVCALPVYIGLDFAFALIAPDETMLGYALRYVRYATLTFMLTFIAPWVFIKIGLAERQAVESVQKATQVAAAEPGI
jgi:membrane-associated phospholipid phosphatase